MYFQVALVSFTIFLESEHGLDPDNDRHLWWLHFVFLPIVNKHLTTCMHLDKRATNSLGVTFYRRWSFWGTYKYYLNCLRWVLYTTIFRMIFIAIATFLCNLISCSMMRVLLITSMTFVWCILLKIALCIMVIDYFAHNKSHFPNFKTRHVT